ncbi:InlB B-repeat-containing protein [Halanaerobium saccharolyticum]|uniref:InlB B-repeat-containing protein n=1 Tax=Halanaerobium saccharolyticum TaxID=43595 RepID=UPI003FCDF048
MKKKILFGILLLILSVSLAGCSSGSDDVSNGLTNYSLTVNTIGDGEVQSGNKVFQSGEANKYNKDTIVTLSPFSSSGWVFSEWRGNNASDLAQDGSEWVITMNDNKDITAAFIRLEHNINITKEGQGTVTQEVVSTPQGDSYTEGTVVKLTANPADGWIFDHWSGDLTGTENPKNITVDAEKNIKATFVRLGHNVNITKEGQGIVTQEVVSTPQGDSYTEGTVVKLTANPADGWKFDHWSGDLTGSENPKNIAINSEKNIIAVFTDNTLTNLSNGNGNITIKDFGSDNYVLGLVYSTADSGATSWSVGKFSTETTSDGNLSELDPSRSLENGFLKDGSQSIYLKEMEYQARKNHKNFSRLFAQSKLIKAAPALGDEQEFDVYNFDGTFKNVTANLKGIGEHVLIWVDNAHPFNSTSVTRMINEFDNTIYPTVTDNFGSVPDGNTFAALNQQDSRVNVLITPLDGAGGYFWANDLYSKSEFPNSNEQKIFFVHNYNDDRALDYQISTLAHEFQHMVFYNEDIVNDKPYFGITADSWINEGFAQLAEDMVGYGYLNDVGSDLSSYLSEPGNTSLIYWGQTLADYDVSYLFARYIYDRFGEGVVDYIHKSNEIYPEAISSYADIPFRQIYEDWAMAVLFDSFSDVTNPKYKFSTIDIPLPAGYLGEPGQYWTNESLKGWSSVYTIIENGDGSDLNISVENAAIDGEMYLKTYKGVK